MEQFNGRFRSHDWEGTSLGNRETWPLTLSAISDSMLEMAQPAFVLWGCDQAMLFNAAFAELLGASGIEALGVRRADLPAGLSEIVAPFVSSSTAAAPELAEDVPFRASVNGSAETRYYSLASSPLRDPAGNVVGTFALCADNSSKVTALRRLERERSAIFRLFMEARGFIAILAGPEHRFVFTNPSYLKLAGRAGAVVGETVQGAFPETVDQGFVAILDTVYATGERFVANRMPIELGHRSGAGLHLRYLNFVYEPMKNEEDAVIGIFVEGHDVTDEVLAQEQVQLLQSELIHLARVSAMEAMASTLAHELNQPITAVRNYVSGCQRLLERGSDSAQIGRALREIGKSAARAGEIIGSLREMTRRHDIQRGPFDPNEAIRKAVSLADIEIGGAVAVECRFGAGEPGLGDAIQIQQVLFNLIRNACEAARTAEEPRVVVTSLVADGRVLVRVEDNGPGIAPENLPYLFDSFFSTKTEGMGVGLSISRTIIEAHGGEIWAENLPVGGARFSFSVPLAETRPLIHEPA